MEDGARHATGRAVARTLVPATIAFASLAWGVSQIAAANRARHLRSFEGVSPDSESALFGHVLGQTAVFAAVLTLVVVLVLGRRAMYALVAAGGLLLSILASAGPLSLLPGTLWAGQDTFAATAGWRALVAGAVCLVMVAAVVTLRLSAWRTSPASGCGVCCNRMLGSTTRTPSPSPCP